MRIIVDLDGVICEETKPYASAHPMPGAKEMLDFWKKQGHKIIIHTARRRCDRRMTLRWLWFYEIPYHSLIMGKPKGDLYIDDKGHKFTGWGDIMP